MHAACIAAIENDALGYGISDLLECLKGAFMKEATLTSEWEFSVPIKHTATTIRIQTKTLGSYPLSLTFDTTDRSEASNTSDHSLSWNGHAYYDLSKV